MDDPVQFLRQWPGHLEAFHDGAQLSIRLASGDTTTDVETPSPAAREEHGSDSFES